MTTSVDTKARKKQLLTKRLALPPERANSPSFTDHAERQLEQALLALESACMQVLDSQFAENRHDMDGLYWQRIFKNIVTPVSLALAEHKGPRRFHYHYRHREEDESVLYPVLEPNPLDLLAHVCNKALEQCNRSLIGIHNRTIDGNRRKLEQALKRFIMEVSVYKKAVA